MSTRINTLTRPGSAWTTPAGNLYVLSVGPRELGFGNQLRDTSIEKNAWRAFAGISLRSRFRGRRSTKGEVMAWVESEVRR